MSWKNYKIGDFLTRSKEPVKIKKQEEYTLVTIRMYHKGVVKRSHVKGSSIKSTTLYKVRAGQFILSGIDARNRAFGIVPEELEGAIVTNDFWTHNIDTSIININFFYWFTTTPQFYEACIKASEGTTNRQRLQADKFYSFDVLLPSTDEQEEWVERVSYIQNKHEQLDKELDQQQIYLQLLRQTMLQEAVQGKLTKQDPTDEPTTELLKRIKAEKEKLIKAGKLKKEKELPPITEEEIPFDLPKGWLWCRLGEITELIYGNSLTKANCKPNGRYPVFGSNGVVGFYDNFLTEKRAIIIGRKGSAGALNISSVPSWTTDVAYYVEEAKYMNFDFMFWLLKSLNLDVLGKGIKPGLNRNEAYALLLALPPLAEQQRIVAKVHQLQQQLSQLEAQVQQSRQYARQLLQSVLKEAFEQKGKVIQLPTETLSAVAEDEAVYQTSAPLNIPQEKRAFAKQVLAGKIISLFKDDTNFTSIKFQKLQYLAEHIAQTDLNWNYYYQSAGPYDNVFMHSIDAKLKKSQWFLLDDKKYTLLNKANEIDKYYEIFFTPVANQLKKLFTHFRNASEAQSEIVATLYAVWNNLLIRKEQVSDDNIMEKFYNWSDRKGQYKQEQLLSALKWMRENNVVPVGFGKEIKKAKK